MSRYSAGCKTGAGSTTLPLISLYGSASGGCAIREIGAFNTTTTSCDIKLVRITTAGTKGAALTNARHDQQGGCAALCTAFNTHSSTGPTLGEDLGYRASLGAAVGAGIIWTFGDRGLIVPAVATGAIGIVIENGTGQALQAYIVFDE